jgi:hypothetical protein
MSFFQWIMRIIGEFAVDFLGFVKHTQSDQCGSDPTIGLIISLTDQVRSLSDRRLNRSIPKTNSIENKISYS